MRSTMTRIPRGSAPTYTTKSWTLGTAPWQALPTPPGSRTRVIIDNDFSGDPDDLYQLVHHLLSPTVDIRAVIGSHLRERSEEHTSELQSRGHLVCPLL